MGLVEFFAMEAADYLERLDALVSRPGGPAEGDRAEFVRLVRALRGSALMANQQAFAAAAAALERLARAVQAGQLAWDATTTQLAVRTVDDLKILVRKVPAWSEADSHRAERVAAALNEALGGAALAASPAPKAPSEGQRAIIAQRGAALASTLDQAAAALRQNPQAQGPLNAVRQTILPLRGIASLADYPPLPDLLDAIERVLAAITSRPAVPPEVAEVLSAAAQAIARAARDIASQGKADPEASEARALVSRLNDLFGLGPDVVSIETLFYDDGGPHIVKAGAQPARTAHLGNLELVSHGEHLRQVADALERAATTLERELRAQALIATLQDLATSGGGTWGTALAEFAGAARDAVARGEPARRPAEFARNLRQAAEVLTAAGSESEEVLAERLARLTAGFKAVPAEAPGAEAPGLVGSYQRFEQLVQQFGLGPASLEELLAGPPGEPAPVPIRTEPPRAAPVPAGAGVAEEAGIVPIADLLYRGEAAFRRALSLREQVRSLLAQSSPNGSALRELVEEVFDLIQLGIGSER